MPVFPAPEIEPGVPGALIEEDYQYEFRNLLFGSGTDFVTTEVTGLLGSATARDQDVDKGHDHGSHPGMIFYGKRFIAFDMTIRAANGADMEQKLEAAARAFQLPRIRNSKNMEPFIFRRPGVEDKVCYARCTKRDFPSNFKTAKGLAVGSVELQAPDPVFYSLTPSHADLDLPPTVTTGGVLVPMDGSHADGAKPLLTLTGPATNPVIENDTDDSRAIRLQVTLGANDAVRIDIKKRIVEHRIGLAGAWNRNYAIVRADSQWWALLPGNNQIIYSRTGSSTTSTLDIDWQDAWA